MKKWIGITRVRNECDIIEMFVRQNLSVLDELYIIVNNCTDTTTQILSELKKEGLPLIPYSDSFLDNRQEIVITQLLRTQIDPASCEWCFLLDADEFITVSRETLELELRDVSADSLAAWRAKTYVPLQDIDDQNLSSDIKTTPFHSINFRRDPEPDPNWRKIIVPSSLFNSINVSPGSHNGCDDNDNYYPIHIIPSRLIHIPARSEEQLKSKYLLGTLSLWMKNGRQPIEGGHWDKGYSLIKSDANLSVTKTAFLVDGGGGEGYEQRAKLLYDPINWSASAIIKYNPLRKVSAFLNLLNFSQILTAQFKEITKKLEKGEISGKILATTACKHGLFAYYKNDFIIGKSLELYGEWGEHELECLSSYLREGDTVIDVGANIGTHAVYFAKRVGKRGVVHAFEPQRRTFHLLNMNAALNACGNLITHQEAIGDRSGTISVPNIDYHEMANIGAVTLVNGGEDTVPIRTIDDLQLEHVSLIKVDVEGMEREVILGAVDTIRRCQPILFVENNIEERSFNLLESLSGFGYRLYWHLSPYFNERNFFGNKFNFLEQVGRPEINILALPTTIDASNVNLEPVTSSRDTWKEGYARACQNARSYLT